MGVKMVGRYLRLIVVIAYITALFSAFFIGLKIGKSEVTKPKTFQLPNIGSLDQIISSNQIVSNSGDPLLDYLNQKER